MRRVRRLSASLTAAGSQSRRGRTAPAPTAMKCLPGRNSCSDRRRRMVLELTRRWSASSSVVREKLWRDTAKLGPAFWTSPRWGTAWSPGGCQRGINLRAVFSLQLEGAPWQRPYVGLEETSTASEGQTRQKLRFTPALPKRQWSHSYVLLRSGFWSAQPALQAGCRWFETGIGHRSDPSKGGDPCHYGHQEG